MQIQINGYKVWKKSILHLITQFINIPHSSIHLIVITQDSYMKA